MFDSFFLLKAVLNVSNWKGNRKLILALKGMMFTKEYSEMLRGSIQAKVPDLSPVTSDRAKTRMEMYENLLCQT